MATKEQVKELLVKKTLIAFVSAISWNDLVSQLDASDKSTILAYVRNQQSYDLGKLLVRKGVDAGRVNAEAKADLLLADDSLSLEEMDSFL